MLSTFILTSCSNESQWEILFDGETVNGLRGYRQSDFPSDHWTIVDGTLKTIAGHGTDLISENVYKDFDSWNIEYEIPFQILKFNNSEEMGINFIRYIKRNNEYGVGSW